jgi:hypothetical protein
MTNTKQQTAVELFAIALYQKFKLEGNGKELNDLVEQAKETEKNQMVDFAIKCMFNDDIGSNLRNHFIQKYNETYGGNK